MKKYWIIVDGKPLGPLSQAELTSRADFGADLPVWHSELPEWTTVGELEELAVLLPEGQSAAEESSAAEEPAKEEPKEPKETMDTLAGLRSQWLNLGAVNGEGSTRRKFYGPQDEIDGEKRPATYIGWNIVMLLCCCMPAGIVGLIFGSQVNRHWMMGEPEKARRSSEYAAWCLILAIVLGLVAWPFQALFQLI